MGNSSTKRTNSGPADAGSRSDDDDADVPPPAKAPGLWASAKQGYEEVIKAIIRPPRAEYELADLGPEKFPYCGKEYQRTDVVLVNKRGMKLCCSHWEPVDSDRPAKELPCVIYLHGNSSCRAACLDNLDVAFGIGATMFAFDFAGSGLSDGEWVTLGEFEKDDVATVIEHLRGTGKVSGVALWGRSMGAATALLHSHRDPSIACIILDSPFADLRQLANEMVAMGKEQTGVRVPGLLVKAAIKIVQQAVLKRSGLDLNKLKPIEDVDKAFTPALFCHGEHDIFIGPHHSKEIYAKYAGDKQLVIVPGDHNAIRPPSFQRNAADFLRNAMRIPLDWELVGDPESRESVPESWMRSRRRGPRFASSRGHWGADGEDEEDEMIRQAMAASMLLASGGKSLSQSNKPSGTRAAASVSSAGGGGGGGGGMVDDDRLDSAPHAVSGAAKSGSHGPEDDEDFGDLGIAEAFADVEGVVAGHDALVPQHILFGLASEATLPTADWSCTTCTFVNCAGRGYCEMCAAPFTLPGDDAPRSSTASVTEVPAAVSSDERDVFFPTRTPAQSLAEPQAELSDAGARTSAPPGQ